MAERRILRDLRVVHPVPRGFVVYGDPPVEYAVRSVVNMKNKELTALFDLDRPEGDRENMAEQQIRMAKQIKLVCPTFPDDVLTDMDWQETVDFHAAVLGAGPPPLLQSLGRLLESRVPCEGPCEHADCPYLHDLWAIKDKMAEAMGVPADPLPSVPATAT